MWVSFILLLWYLLLSYHCWLYSFKIDIIIRQYLREHIFARFLLWLIRLAFFNFVLFSRLFEVLLLYILCWILIPHLCIFQELLINRFSITIKDGCLYWLCLTIINYTTIVRHSFRYYILIFFYLFLFNLFTLEEVSKIIDIFDDWFLGWITYLHPFSYYVFLLCI
jgi:hypothetical protein